MGRISTKEFKTVYQSARDELDLSREKASELTGLEPYRIERIENEKMEETPWDVVAMANAYEKAGIEKHNLSRDITATSTVLCPLIPWNVSGLYITGLFGISSLVAVPYAFCAFLTPLLSYVFIAMEMKRKS